MKKEILAKLQDVSFQLNEVDEIFAQATSVEGVTMKMIQMAVESYKTYVEAFKLSVFYKIHDNNQDMDIDEFNEWFNERSLLQAMSYMDGYLSGYRDKSLN